MMLASLLAADPTAATLTTGDALGLAGLIVSGLIGLWVGTLRYTIASKEQEHNRRFGETNAELATLRADVRSQNERLHTDEKKTIEQGKDLERFNDKHERFEKDIADIKERVERDMVTKSEMHGLERMMREKLDELLRTQRPGYQPRGTPSPGQYGVRPSSDPPKKDR